MKKITYIVMIMLLLLIIQACDVDTTFVFELNKGIDTIEIQTKHQDAMATARVGRRMLNVVVYSNEVDTTRLGTYEITYETTYLNEIYRLTRYVTVVDETPPVITLNAGVDTIFLNETWMDAFVTVYDNSLGETTIVVEGEVDINQIGQYEITYIATDESGNTASLVRYVNVILRETIQY